MIPPPPPLLTERPAPASSSAPASRPAPPAPVRPDYAGHLLAAPAYLLLSLVVTFPMLLHPATDGLGELYLDRAKDTWNFWWVKVALLDLHTNPFHTDLLLYPQGADLYYHTLNLPAAVLLLGPLLLWGPVAAYNLGALFALTLAGYAGYRLVAFLTGSRVAGLLGGLIIGFNPLAHAMLQGMINIVSLGWFVLCIEFYLRSWDGGRRRDMILTGVFFILSVLTGGYFEVYLLLFFAVHALWLPATTARAEGRAGVRALGRRAALIFAWAGGTAALVVGPYAFAAVRSLQKGQIVLWSAQDPERTLANSADLLSFLVPNRNHLLLGGGAPWWAGINPNIHDYTYLGLVTVALAAAGAWAARRQARTGLWLAVAALGVILACGPVLQINGQQTFGGGPVPLPLQLLQPLPLVGLVRFPERFVTLTYVALAVLAAGGLQRVLGRLPPARQSLVAAAVLGLVLLEMPLRPRVTDPMPIPASLAALGRDPAPGAVLELPLTQLDRVAAPRMYYQTGHGRPITSAYISRTFIDPYTQACSPFQAFALYPRIEAEDIVSPTVAGQLTPGLLAAHGIGFLTVYKQGLFHSLNFEPLEPARLAELQALAGRLGTPLADDAMATTYRVRPAAERPGLFLQLGPDWHALERSEGRLFRWIAGARADLCVFSPAAQTAPLTFQVAGFAAPRHLQVWIGDQQVLDGAVPADGALHALQTPPIAWPAGPQLVRLVVPEGSASPAALGQGSDTRQLSLGFSVIRLGAGIAP